MSQKEYSLSEEYFVNAWGVIERDRDFGDNPTAQEVYGSENPHEVDHFVYPVLTDDGGHAYVKKNMPLELFAELYPQLEDETMEFSERFDAAIDRAWNAELDEDGIDTLVSGKSPVENEIREEHVDILEDTKRKLE